MKKALYYHQTPIIKFSYRLVMISMAITLGIFVLMPMLEVLVKKKQNLNFRDVETVKILKPPPIPPMKKNASIKPKPQLDQPIKRLEIMPIDLALDINPGQGDFALNFGLAYLGRDEVMIFEIAEVDKQPQLVHRVNPLYPLAARHRKIEGQVMLEFIVLPNGKVDKLKIRHADPPGVFEQAALQAVKKWRFEPGTKNREPVGTRVLVPMQFTLD